MGKRTQKVVVCLVQIAILAGFAAMAMASGSEQTLSTIRAGAQGAGCSSMGYTFVGYYDDCESACAKKGYSRYCSGEDTVACYCK